MMHPRFVHGGSNACQYSCYNYLVLAHMHKLAYLLLQQANGVLNVQSVICS